MALRGIDINDNVTRFYSNGYNDLVTILIVAKNIRLPIEWPRIAVFEKRICISACYPAHCQIEDWKSTVPCGSDVPTNQLDKNNSFMR